MLASVHRDRLAGLLARSVSLLLCFPLSRSLARAVRLARSLALPFSRSLPLRRPSLSLSRSLVRRSLARSLRRPLLVAVCAVRGLSTVFIPRFTTDLPDSVYRSDAIAH